jgi:hypothetical protein
MEVLHKGSPGLCAGDAGRLTLPLCSAPRRLAFVGTAREDRLNMFSRLRELLRRRFRKRAGPREEATLEPPLKPGEAAFKIRPGEEPPLQPGETGHKARPGEEPPLGGEERER